MAPQVRREASITSTRHCVHFSQGFWVAATLATSSELETCYRPESQHSTAASTGIYAYRENARGSARLQSFAISSGLETRCRSESQLTAEVHAICEYGAGPARAESNAICDYGKGRAAENPVITPDLETHSRSESRLSTESERSAVSNKHGEGQLSRAEHIYPCAQPVGQARRGTQ
jgi:hypothetical protein